MRYAALLMLFCSQCFAGEIMLDLGATHFSQAGNGIWYQEGFPYDLHMTSPSVALKYYTDKSEDGWQFGAGYDYIGKATSSALAVGEDWNYNANSPTHCNGACLPLSHWYGSGEVDGVFIAARKNIDSWIIEGGVMATRPTWHEVVPDFVGCYGCAPQFGQETHDNKIMYDPFLSVGYRITGNVAFLLSAIPTHAKGDAVPGIYKGYSPTAALEFSF